MSERSYGRALHVVRGPIPRERVERVLAGMGREGAASRRLVERGLAPPELPTGFTLALLAGQPRRPAADGAPPRPSAVAGGVWVREQLTVCAPVPLDVPIVISGASLRRFARKGRCYSVSASRTHDQSGRLLARNLTTGLERYRADPELEDFEEGAPESELPAAEPDARAAAANPSRERLRALRRGDVLVGDAVEISMSRLRARDGPRPENPIHSDPDAARDAGLDVPIAGGAHVLAFLQEVLLQAWGEEALYHGAHLDVRWVAPVRAGSRIAPGARVTGVGRERIELALELHSDGELALTGRAIIPV